MDAHDTDLKRLPLEPLHQALGARFAPFAGYSMPVQYEGVLAEHAWTRTHAGLFDVSHMGPAELVAGDHAAGAAVLERLVPSDIQGLKPGQQRYTVLLNQEGGILDDLMAARPREDDGRLWLVVNAGCKEADFPLIAAMAGGAARLERLDHGALLALQGPEAAQALARLVPETAQLSFMQVARFETGLFGRLVISRSGYTGEDGFEIWVAPEFAAAFAEAVLSQPEVKPIGLGARDTLRLEAGLCLYGHDLDPETSPIEADLAWVIQKRRRLAGDFPGAERILRELKEGPAKRRVGLLLDDRAPAREGAQIQHEGLAIGQVTSGGVGPTIGRAISMGYVAAAYAAPGQRVDVLVRDRPRPATIVALPFTPHRYVEGGPA